MGMYLDFEPHSYYMGFAIQCNLSDIRGHESGYPLMSRWQAYAENGNFYVIDKLEADTLHELKKLIRDYHLNAMNGYGERIAQKQAKS
jgi:hypothetical protein